MTSSTPHHRQAEEWAHMLRRFDPAVRAQVAAVARTHQQPLAQRFYDAMMEDAAAAQFLSHDQVQSRLHKSMQLWVAAVLAASPDEDLTALVARQIHIGEVHARIDLPVHLVLRGARCLKDALHDLLHGDCHHDAAHIASACLLAAQIMDHAMEVMSQAYDSSRDKRSRDKEAYRLFAVTQNAAAERERFRASLLDWESQCIFDYAVGVPTAQLPRLAGSEFGLWFRHKGAHVFQGTQECDLILDAIRKVDDELLPAMHQGDGQARSQNEPQLRALREYTRYIAMHLDALYAQRSELDAGRDALTSLLNRKFLPAVMSKELAYAREHGASFSVLSIDVDHFKQVNDQHGHDGGDAVLQQLATIMSTHTRSGDYLFRMGGEEFLLLLVDCKPMDAERVAEKLRAAVAAHVFQLPRNVQLQATISLGVANFNGHPDYQTLLKRADEALYQAKAEGRNRAALML